MQSTIFLLKNFDSWKYYKHFYVKYSFELQLKFFFYNNKSKLTCLYHFIQLKG